MADVGGAAGECLLGLLADEVLEVLAQPAAALALPPALPGVAGHRLATVQAGDRLVSVFDVAHLGVDTQALPNLAAKAV